MTNATVSDTTKECLGCGRTLKNPRKYRYCSKRCYVRSAEHKRRLRAWHAKRAALGLPRVPLPAEIAAECIAIQAMWSDAERVARMRPDLRPIPWELQCVPCAALSVKEL
jgi:hypothetical protein